MLSSIQQAYDFRSNRYNLQQGKAAEHLVCFDLLRQGFNAFLSDQGLPYDVLVQTKNSIKTIQVRSTQNKKSFRNGKTHDIYRFGLRCAKRGARRCSITNIDYFAFVALDSKKIGYINSRELLVKGGLMCGIELKDRSANYRGRLYSNGTIRKPYGRFINDYEKFPEEVLS